MQISIKTLGCRLNRAESEQIGDKLKSFGFNVNYLMEGLSALPPGPVKLAFTDADSGVRMESDAALSDIQVVMPTRL